MATSQFYFYGKKYCTKTGWKVASASYKKPDLLESDISLAGKVYLVTGANAGIGYGISEYLAQKGGTVYMFCRNEERGKKKQAELVEKMKNPNVHLIVCDCGGKIEFIARLIFVPYTASLTPAQC